MGAMFNIPLKGPGKDEVVNECVVKD